MADTPELKTLFSRVMIRRDETPKVTKGGIIKPDIAMLPMHVGIVEAIGHTVEVVKVGDRVLYGRFAGQDTPLPEDGMPEHLAGKDRFFIYEKDIHLILPSPEAS